MRLCGIEIWVTNGGAAKLERADAEADGSYFSHLIPDDLNARLACTQQSLI